MNLIKDRNKENKQSSSIIKVISVVIVILIILAIILGIYITKIKEESFKFFVNGKQYSVSEDVITIDNNVLYVNVKTIAGLVGYEYNNGEYNNPYVEDKTKCYVKSENEIASFIAESNRIYKVLLEVRPEQTITETDNKNNNNKNKNNKIDEIDTSVKTPDKVLDETEYFTLNDNVKIIDGIIYATEEAIEIGYNIYFSYNSKNNRVDIYTLSYLIENYKGKIANSVLDDSSEFSNKKLLKYNMVLIKNSEGFYGVNTLEGETVIGTKYKNIKFIESSKDFIVTTEENKQGISSLKTNNNEYEIDVKIPPQYDKIRQLDQGLDLFLVYNNGKYGVVDGQGKIIIHMEYDQIGINNTIFINNQADNPYLLYNEIIPVKKDEKWGLMNTNGRLVLAMEYDNIGCISGTSITKTENNLLLIPDINGIVISKDGKYGISNIKGEIIVPCALDEMFKTITSGKNTYFMSLNEVTNNVLEWIQIRNSQ